MKNAQFARLRQIALISQMLFGEIGGEIKPLRKRILEIEFMNTYDK